MESPGRVLVVDDDAAITEAIAAALHGRYEVLSAATASEAIVALCARELDLILLDHQLPDLLGVHLLKLVKQLFPSISVIIVTGQGSEAVAVEAFRAGARDYLNKPFSLPDLLKRVDSIFAARRVSGEARPDPYFQLVDSHLPSRRPTPDLARGRSILRALHYAETHLATPLALEAIARVAGMSRFHFCREFRQMIGQSFHAFVLRQRIDRAKELLRLDGRPLAEVATEVGFRDPTHFGRTFRKLEGMLPSEFRRHAHQ